MQIVEVCDIGLEWRLWVAESHAGLPGTGTLSPSTGLWYPGGETKRCLTLKEGCDSIHMHVDVVVSSCLCLPILCYIQVDKQ